MDLNVVTIYNHLPMHVLYNAIFGEINMHRIFTNVRIQNKTISECSFKIPHSKNLRRTSPEINVYTANQLD